jgi:hypothetical protein
MIPTSLVENLNQNVNKGANVKLALNSQRRMKLGVVGRGRGGGDGEGEGGIERRRVVSVLCVRI